MAEVDKTLNEAPVGIEEDITLEAVNQHMEVEVEGDEEVELKVEV